MTWLKSTFLAAQLARQSTPQQLQDNMYKICTDTVNQLSRQQFVAVDEKGETNPPLRTLPSVAHIPHFGHLHRHLQLASRSFRWLLSRHATSCAWRQQCSSESSLPAQSHVSLVKWRCTLRTQLTTAHSPTETAAVPHAMEHILAEALRVVSRSEEFAERNVRVKEKRELNAINTRDGRFTYEKGKKVTTPAVQYGTGSASLGCMDHSHRQSCCRQRSSICCKRPLAASRWVTMHCKVCSHTSRASGSGATHIPQCATQLRLRQP